MSLKYTIYIPSKNRSDNCKTAQILLKHEFKSFKIVIEPQDYKDYLKSFWKKGWVQSGVYLIGCNVCEDFYQIDRYEYFTLKEREF